MHYNENIVDVNFEVIIEDKKTKLFEKLNETHRMRYLFLPEIMYLSKKYNLSYISSYTWNSFEPLSEKSWYGIVVLKK